MREVIEHRGNILAIHRSVQRLTHSKRVHSIGGFKIDYGDNVPFFTEKHERKHRYAHEYRARNDKPSGIAGSNMRLRIAFQHAFG